MKISEVIVVEGKDDTTRIQQVVVADTIETIGSAINDDILAMIEHAEETRGVIIFTDPDFSGEKIRKTIMERVPSARHAFLPRAQAKPSSSSKGRSLGVEHAADADIIEALRKVVTPVLDEEDDYQEISRDALSYFGLLDGSGSKIRREKLGDILRIGFTNGKQLRKRLKMFRITEEQLAEAMQQVEEEIKDGADNGL